MAHVELRGVRKSFGDMEVVHGVDCVIRHGEFAVIVGPSGCGKSTLLRCIAGLEEVSDGEILIGGRKVNDLEPKDRDIAMVFQNYALYPHMTALKNMAYGLHVRGFSRQETEGRVNRAARILRIQDFLQRKPSQLSGGQRQRVAMGRAIVREPKAFLFDEPLSNLDAKLRTEMRVEIKKLHLDLQATSIFVTHDQVEAMTLADRLIVLNDGNTEQIGSPLEVYNAPATTFVAGFIGSPAMNFLPAGLDPDGNQVEIPNGQNLILGNRFSPPAGSRDVTVGVRAEHFRVTGEGGPNTMAVGIELVEELGAEAILYGRIGAHKIVARIATQGTVRAGDHLHLKVRPSHIHLFDAITGARLPSEGGGDAS